MADSPQVFQSPCRYLSALVPFLRSTARCRPLPPPPRARRNATHDISLPDTCLSGRQCFTSRSLCRQYVDAALDPPGALRMTRSRCGWAGSAARLRSTALPRCPPVDHLSARSTVLEWEEHQRQPRKHSRRSLQLVASRLRCLSSTDGDVLTGRSSDNDDDLGAPANRS